MLSHVNIERYNAMLPMRYSQPDRSWLDGNLEALPRVHLVECLLVVLQFEHVRDLRRYPMSTVGMRKCWITHHALDINLTTIEISDGTGETVGLRE